MTKYIKLLIIISVFVTFLTNADSAFAAITSAGTLGATSSKSNNQTSLVHTVTATAEAGNLVIFTVARDNVTLSDTSDEASHVSSVTDSQGNSYTLAHDFTNDINGTQSGAWVGVYYSVIDTQLTGSTDTITVNFANTAEADATAISAWEYTVGAGNVVAVESTTERTDDNADAGSVSISALTSQEYLFFRGIGAETDNTGGTTNTTNYTTLTDATTTGNPEHGNMAVAGEFRIVTATGETSDPTLTDTNNDNVSVFIAFKEQATIDISGVIRDADESTAYLCDTTGNLTVNLRVNGSGTDTVTCTADTGEWDITGLTASTGDTITVYLDAGSVRAAHYLVSDGSNQTNVDLYTDRVVLRDDDDGSITTAEIDSGDTTDADDLVTGSYVTPSSYETHIWGGDTFAPGTNVTTGKLHIPTSSNYSGNTETLELQGTGTGTSRPLYVDGGTFTTPDQTTFTGDGDVAIEGTTYDALSFTPTITAGRAYTFTAGATINGAFQINPDAASALALTVNLGGTTTVQTASTTTITKTNSATSVMDTTGSNHAFSTGLLNIATGGTLTGNGSTITLTGTSGTLWTHSGTFTEGSSTVVMDPDAAVTLFSADPTVNNLSLTPTITAGRAYTVGSALTINGDLNINPTASSSLELTVNMGGNITVASTGTTTLTGTTSGTSSLVTTASNYNLSTGLLNIASAGTLDASSSTSTITLTGTSGTLWTHSGTFTEGSSTVVMDPDAAVTLFSADPTVNNLSLTPTITAGRAYEIGSALTINGNFTINPTADSSLALTVNAGGNITGAATTTTTISGTTSGTSTLDLRPATTDYDLSTGLLDIASAGTLDLASASSTVTLNGTAGTLFTRTGIFNEGTSTVLIANASGTPTLNSGTITFYDLTINGTDITATTSADNITISNTLTVETGETLSLAAGQILTHSGSVLTLNGTISGTGRLDYSSGSNFPTSGTFSADLRLDATGGNHNISARTYGGNLELYSNSSGSSRTFTLGTGSTQTITISGNLNLVADNTQNVVASAATHNPTVNITGNLDFTGTGGGSESVTTGTGTWTVSGSIDFTGGSLTATSGNTIVMDGTSQTLTSASQTLQNFESQGTISNADAMDVDGTFSVTAGTFTQLDSANIDISVAGDFTIGASGAWSAPSSNTDANLIFDGDIDFADSAGSQNVGFVIVGTSPETTNLTTDFTANSLTIAAGDFFNTCEYEVDIGNNDITINGTLDTSASGNAGSVSPCSAGNEGDETTINLASTFTISGTGTFVQDNSTLIMDNPSGTDTITMDGESLYNLTVSPGGTIQFADTIGIDNNVSITSGTLDLNSQTITIGGNFDNDAAMTAGTSSVTFNATSGTKTIDADGTGTEAFYDVIFDDGGGSATFQLTTLIDVDNDFTITNGTFDANGQNLNIGGSYSNGGTFTSNSNITTFDDTDGGETLAGDMTGSSSFYDLVFNDGGNSGAWSFGSNAATATNDFTITGGTATAPSTTLTIGGNFDNQDGFTHNSGTVEFNDSGKTSVLTYAATTTFNNMTIQTGSKTVNFEETNTVVTDVNGAFTVQGGACGSLITLNSESGADDWELDLTGATVDVDFTDISFSNSVTAVTADNSTNGGNNTNWTINEGECAPVDVRMFGGVRGFDGVRFRP